MDSIDDLTCKLDSLQSDQQTNDTLSPNLSRSTEILKEIKKTSEQNNKSLFPLKDQIYNQLLQMKTMTIQENYQYQMCSIIFLSEYHDNSTYKLENIQQLLQECTNLNLKTYFIVINNNKKSINLKELRALVQQFPCSLILLEIDIDDINDQLRLIEKEQKVGSLISKFFIHISTNKAMKQYFESLLQSLSKFESMLTNDDKIYYSVQPQSEKLLTVEISEPEDERRVAKENKRKYVFYTFVTLVSISAICYLLYAMIIPFI